MDASIAKAIAASPLSHYFRQMVEHGASDLFLSSDAPASLKINE